MSAGPARRCETHGLAAGPDGQCALCRRVDTPSEDLVAPGAGSRPLLVGAGVVIALVVGAFAWSRVRAEDPTTVVSAEPAPTRNADPQTSQTTPPPAELPHPGLIEPRAGSGPGTGSEPAPRYATTAMAPPPPRAQAPQDDTLAATRAARETRDLLEARRRVTVTMYSTSWCPSCRAAREWLSSAGISYSDLDVEHDPSARAAQHALNPRGSVPTTDIDGRVLVGFSPGSFTAALDEAARRRAAHF